MSSRMGQLGGSHLLTTQNSGFGGFVHKCLCNSNFGQSWWILFIPKLGLLSVGALQLWYGFLVSASYQIQEKQEKETEYLRISKSELCSGVESGAKKLADRQERFRGAETVPLSALQLPQNQCVLIFQVS